MRIPKSMMIALIAVPLSAAAAEKPLSFQDEATRIGYSVGYQIGENLQREGVTLNADAVAKGIADAVSGANPPMKPEEMRTMLIALKRKVFEGQLAKRKAELQKQMAEDKKFLEENAKKKGVITTASGLQYEIITKGTGKTPGPTDQVTVNYRGTLTDGKEFDSSYKRGKPATFKLGGVIKGWTEGLQHIAEGGKINLVVPPALAYGQHGPLAGRTLVFDVELLSVGANKPAAAGAQQTAKPAGSQSGK